MLAAFELLGSSGILKAKPFLDLAILARFAHLAGNQNDGEDHGRFLPLLEAARIISAHSTPQVLPLESRKRRATH